MADGGDILLQAKDRSKSTRTAVWSTKSPCVKPGEVVGLLGLMEIRQNHHLLYDCRPNQTEWRASGSGRDMSRWPCSTRPPGMGYSQEPSVFNKLTVEENIMSITELAMSRKERADAGKAAQ